MAEQLTLGDLEIKVRAFADYQKKFGGDGRVYYDFGRFFPKFIDSWRGDYSHLALDISSGDEALKITEFHDLLKKANGSDFEGWKGGTYTAHDETPLWVAERGDLGHTAVFDVIQNYDDLIIVTGFETY